MRLIDADALKDKCYITVNGTTIGRNNYVMFHEIDDAPTIDAVEVVRCGECEDCISRQAAIEAIEERFFAGTVADINPSWRLLHDIIESLPPVEPKRPKGEWIENAPEGQGIDPPYICPICGHAESMRTPFCEQCGARMKGADDE